MIDFLIVNFLTESGGLVEIFSYAYTEGSLFFIFELNGGAIFCEDNLSLDLTVVTFEKWKVSLSGVSSSSWSCYLNLWMDVDECF